MTTMVELRRLVNLMRVRMTRSEILSLIQHRFVEYHGHHKFEIGNLLMTQEDDLVDRDRVLIEIVRVDEKTNPDRQVHVHRNSNAIALILGEKHHFPFPAPYALVFSAELNRWIATGASETFTFEAGTPHGFTVEKKGALYFLSVQSPPIERNGKDDYEIVEV